MEWQAEKMCAAAGDYDLLVERFKNGYECEQSTHSWKWRVIRSGVVIAQGTGPDLEAAQKLAEANVPLNSDT
jgi:hypothetical protein